MRSSLAFVLMVPILGCVLGREAAANVPDPSQCTVPSVLMVVGCNGLGGADPHGDFTVVVRMLNGNPWTHDEDVVLDFGDCVGARLCAEPGLPGLTVDCAARIVRGRVDSNGMITFRVEGSTRNAGASAGPADGCLRVSAGGVLLRTVKVAFVDQTGGDGVDTGDLAAWLTDFFSGQRFARSDYDGDNVLSTADLAIWLEVFFAAGSVLGCAATCP